MSEDEREKAILALARKQWHDEGQIEIDEDPGFQEDGHVISIPAISEGDDNGAYVRAWVWVSFAGTALDKGDSE